MYQTHPRTKGSTGFPDKILTTDHFRDASYLGAGWKAMPSDLSSPRLGDRVFDLVDELNNQGLRKRFLGEVDVFQFDHTHELYAHMNINYIKLDRLPAFDRWGDALAPLAKGEFFTTTGEVLLPEVNFASSSATEIVARARVQWTFPLRFAEIVWGDGQTTHREVIELADTREFGSKTFEWRAKADGWKWARVAVWDVAGNGAFVNPFWAAVRPLWRLRRIITLPFACDSGVAAFMNGARSPLAMSPASCDDARLATRWSPTVTASSWCRESTRSSWRKRPCRFSTGSVSAAARGACAPLRQPPPGHRPRPRPIACLLRQPRERTAGRVPRTRRRSLLTIGRSRRAVGFSR